MPTMDVPCDQCAEVTARFEAEGFTVSGCNPAADGMCTLQFEAPAARGAAVFTGTARSLSATAAGDGGAAAQPRAGGLTPTQAAAAKAIVNLFETSQVLGDYGRVTLIPNDTGRLTYGRSQAALGSGSLHKLLQRYCANPGARFGARLAAHLDAFAAQAASLDADFRVHNLLRAAADDAVMRETQDSFFDEGYWQPAVRAATAAGIATPLGVAVVYDSFVHGSWARIRDKTVELHGKPADAGEQAWIAAYVQARRAWMAASSNSSIRATTYRMDAFERLIDQDLWGLPLPFVVRGQEISTATLSGLPPGCYDGPAPGSRALAVSTPLARGLDVRLLQLGLSDQGMKIVADGVFGKTSQTRVREFQIGHGLPATGVADVGLIARLVG